jgi:hypothetical protein
VSRLADLLATAGLNLFIAALLLLFWCWDLPEDTLSRRLLGPVAHWIRWSGLWHNWGMFAPDPIRTNRQLRAEIRLHDGRVVPCPLVDFGGLPPLRAVIFGRHRKLQENLMLPRFNILKPAYCDFVVREYIRAGGDGVPAEVLLYKAEARIRPPGHPNPCSNEYMESAIFRWTVPSIPTPAIAATGAETRAAAEPLVLVETR